MNSIKEKASGVLDFSFVLSLLLLLSFFYFAKGELNDKRVSKQFKGVMEEYIVIERTVQQKRAVRPIIPKLALNFIEDNEDPIDEIELTEVPQLKEVPIQINFKKEKEEVPFLPYGEKAEIIKRVRPSYPKLAKELGIEAQVFVQFVVNKKGIPEQLKILKGHDLFNENALDAISQYRFRPAMQRDKRVAVKLVIPIRFRLK